MQCRFIDTGFRNASKNIAQNSESAAYRKA